MGKLYDHAMIYRREVFPPGYKVNIVENDGAAIVQFLTVKTEDEEELMSIDPNKFDDDADHEPETVILFKSESGIYIDHYPDNVAAEKFIQLLEQKFKE